MPKTQHQPKATQFDAAAANQMETIISDLGRTYHARNGSITFADLVHDKPLKR